MMSLGMSIRLDIPLNEIANLQVSDTNKLRYPLWVDEKGSERRIGYNKPRLEVCISKRKSDEIPVSINKNNPEILINKDIPNFREVKKFIIKYYDELIANWNHEWFFRDLSTFISLVEVVNKSKKEALMIMMNNVVPYNIPKSLKHKYLDN